MSLSEQVDKVHEELIEQEGIKIAELPAPLKKKLKGWNLLYSRLKKNTDDEVLFRSCQRKSVELADKIQDFIEKDYEEEKTESPKTESATEKSESKQTEKSEEVKSEGGEVASENKPKAKSGVFGNLVMEKKILSTIKENGNGKIRINQLKEIIKKEPSYPEQKVNKITLRKVFLTPEYRVK